LLWDLEERKEIKVFKVLKAFKEQQDLKEIRAKKETKENPAAHSIRLSLAKTLRFTRTALL
jgi:hypothetical protein